MDSQIKMFDEGVTPFPVLAYIEHGAAPAPHSFVYRQHPDGTWQLWDETNGWECASAAEPKLNFILGDTIVTYEETWAEPENFMQL